MYHGERTRAKAIVIDEAWDLLSGDDSRRRSSRAPRSRARKYRGALDDRHPVGQRLLREPRRARRLGELRLGDLPRPEGRVRRAPEIRRSASTAIPAWSSALKSSDHRRRALGGAGAARPGRLARGAPRARRLVGGALLLARPGVRRGRAAGRPQGLTTVEAIDRHSGRGPADRRAARSPAPNRTAKTTASRRTNANHGAKTDRRRLAS